MNELNAGWIPTATGRTFWPLNPHSDDVDIRDIAFGLARSCRFNGQCKFFYSVAEHSVLASHLVSPDIALETLLHDAAEAYFADVASPIKRALPEIKNIERRIEQVIATAFNLTYPWPPGVKNADRKMLAAERDIIVPHPPGTWDVETEIVTPHICIRGLGPTMAAEFFMQRYRTLTNDTTTLSLPESTTIDTDVFETP